MKMSYDEFEKRLLQLVFEEHNPSFTPSFLAYKLKLPHSEIKEHLDQAVMNGIVEIDEAEGGKLAYTIPGFDPSFPSKKDAQAILRSQPDDLGRSGYGGVPERSVEQEAREEVDRIAPIVGGGEFGGGRGAMGSGPVMGSSLPALIDDKSELEAAQPSMSMYVRRFRIYGQINEQMIDEHLVGLLGELGYTQTHKSKKLLRADNLLFERGSILFILLLIPFFILVFPLLVYIVLYTMGRSSIDREPLLLEVGRDLYLGGAGCCEITFTYRGQSGIVIGRPDRDVLDREVELVRQELQNRVAPMPQLGHRMEGMPPGVMW